MVLEDSVENMFIYGFVKNVVQFNWYFDLDIVCSFSSCLVRIAGRNGRYIYIYMYWLNSVLYLCVNETCAHHFAFN